MENVDKREVQGAAAPVGHEFVQVRSGACVLTVRADLRQSELTRFLPGGEAELARHYALERVASASSSRVFRFCAAIGGGDRVVYFKEYVDRSTWDALKHLIRASRARRAFAGSMVLARQGLDAPEILALGEIRRAVLFKRCFLVTLAVTSAKPVYVLLGDDSSGLDTVALRRKRDLLRTLGRMIGRMHRQGIVHGDLRPGNVLARFDGGHWQLFFLDNERTRRLPWLPARLRRKNLVQVGMVPGGVSRTDYFRFWRAYLMECPRLRGRHRQWARHIYARTAARLADCARRSAGEEGDRSPHKPF